MTGYILSFCSTNVSNMKCNRNVIHATRSKHSYDLEIRYIKSRGQLEFTAMRALTFDVVRMRWAVLLCLFIGVYVVCMNGCADPREE